MIGQGPGDPRSRRPRGLLWGHPTGDDGGGARVALDNHHGRVERRNLHRRVEHAVHELLEVDRDAELTEEPVALAFSLGPVERLGEVACEIVHLVPHLVDSANEVVVGRRRRWPAPTG